MSAVFGFRFPNDLRKYVEAQARERGASIGGYIVSLIRQDRDEKTGHQRKVAKFAQNGGCGLKWISIHSESPDSDTACLVLISGCPRPSLYPVLAEWDGTFWVDANGNTVDNVTHWAEAPKPIVSD